MTRPPGMYRNELADEADRHKAEAMRDLMALAELGALGGVWAIMKERLAQLGQGYDAAHDDAHPVDGPGSLQVMAEERLDRGDTCEAGALCAALLDSQARYDAGETS